MAVAEDLWAYSRERGGDFLVGSGWLEVKKAWLCQEYLALVVEWEDQLADYSPADNQSLILVLPCSFVLVILVVANEKLPPNHWHAKRVDKMSSRII